MENGGNRFSCRTENVEDISVKPYFCEKMQITLKPYNKCYVNYGND